MVAIFGTTTVICVSSQSQNRCKSSSCSVGIGCCLVEVTLTRIVYADPDRFIARIPGYTCPELPGYFLQSGQDRDKHARIQLTFFCMLAHIKNSGSPEIDLSGQSCGLSLFNFPQICCFSRIGFIARIEAICPYRSYCPDARIGYVARMPV